jgi:hypothetical protein
MKRRLARTSSKSTLEAKTTKSKRQLEARALVFPSCTPTYIGHVTRWECLVQLMKFVDSNPLDGLDVIRVLDNLMNLTLKLFFFGSLSLIVMAMLLI